MTDTHTAVRLGDGARAIMEDEAFQAAVAYTKAHIFEEWSTTDDYQRREELHGEMKALNRLLDGFEHLFNEGLVAKHVIASADIS